MDEKKEGGARFGKRVWEWNGKGGGRGQPHTSIFATFFKKSSPISENIGYIFLNLPIYIL